MDAKKTKKKAKGQKGKKHKPDWPQMFADRIIDLENRVAALERAAPVPAPADVDVAQETAAPSGT